LVKTLAQGSGASVLMTEANNCNDNVADPYDFVDDIWGTEYSRIYAVPGNHDYMTGIEGFENYFGFGRAVLQDGVPNPNWAIIRINTNYPDMPYGDGGMTESEWNWQKIGLKTMLSALYYQGTECILVYGHHARFSSGLHQRDAGLETRMQEIWEILDQFDVELYLSGHDHHYERMAPMDAGGNVVSDGTMQIVSGTGGADLRSVSSFLMHPSSDFIIDDEHGLLEIQLNDDAFRTAFVGTDGDEHDVYTGVCH
jgi:hypothetical protein